MACGDSLRHLVVTKSGYTPENPNGAFYVPSDWTEWTSLDDKLVEQASKHMAILQSIEAERGKGFRKFNKLSGEWSGLLRAREELPSLLFAAGKDLPRAIDVAMAAVCLLEQVDEAIASYGKEAPEIPSPGREPAPAPTTTLASGFGTVVVLGAVGFAIYYFFMKGVRG